MLFLPILRFLGEKYKYKKSFFFFLSRMPIFEGGKAGNVVVCVMTTDIVKDAI